MTGTPPPWARTAPATWSMARLKATVTACQNGLWGDEPDGQHDIVCVRVADFDRTSRRVELENPTLRSVPAGKRARRVLRSGDLLIEKSGGGELQPVGTVVLYDQTDEAICSNFVARMPVAPGHDPRFLTYLHQALYGLRVPERSIKQTTGIQNLDSDSYLNEKAALPPLAHQRVIAEFLDGKTDAIDALIEKKLELITVLSEKRQAILARAVAGASTGEGIGTESRWWPHVADNRRIVRVRHLVRRIADGPHFSPKYVEPAEGVMFISARNIRLDRWALDDAKYVSPDDFREFSKRIVPEKGDVLYTKGGTTGIARVVDLDIPFQVWVHVAVLKVRPEVVDPHYLAFALNAGPCYAQAQLYTRGATNQDLGLTRMANIELPLPPLQHQRRVASELGREVGRIDELIRDVESSQTLLAEYRQGLITAAVTGQLDVAAQPQEAA